MSNYDVVVSSPNFNVNLVQEDQYNIGVNYEAPLKSIQYTNLILDNISSQFNGSTTSFLLTVNGEPYRPANEQQLVISINGIILRPVVDYQVSGNTLFFTSPPAAGANFSGIALQTTADLTRTIVFMVDNGSQDITPGNKGYLTLDVTGTLESWTVLSETTGTIAFDIEKSSYTNFPNNFVSIVGNEYPILNNQNKNKDDNLTTWNKSLELGDVLRFNVLSCVGVQRCSVFLKLKI